MEVTQGSNIKSKFINGFTKCGVMLKPPMRPTTSFKKESSWIFKCKLTSTFGYCTIVMEHGRCVWHFKKTCQYLKMINTIKLDDFIREFDTWRDMVWHVAIAESPIVYSFPSLEMFILAFEGATHGQLTWILPNSWS
jgi:hypothetical protein